MWQNACDRGGRAHGGRHILPLVLPLVLPLAPTEPPDIGKDDDMRAPVSLGIAAPFSLAAALAAAPAAAHHGWSSYDSSKAMTVTAPVVESRYANPHRSEEHTSELQSLMRISYAVFCLKKKKDQPKNKTQ